MRVGKQRVQEKLHEERGLVLDQVSGAYVKELLQVMVIRLKDSSVLIVLMLLLHVFQYKDDIRQLH